jgi:hypothetical protein
MYASTFQERVDIIYPLDDRAEPLLVQYVNEGFVAQRRFLLTMDVEQKRKFQELLRLDIKSAKMARRYYCLFGQKPVSYPELGMLFGLSDSHPVYICDKVHSVFCYLGAPFTFSKDAMLMAGKTDRKVTQRRVEMERKKRITRLLTGTGLKSVPSGIPPRFMKQFQVVCKLKRTGVIDALRDQDEKLWETITFRFGFRDGLYHTIEEVGAYLDVTRQCVNDKTKRFFRRMSQ